MIGSHMIDVLDHQPDNIEDATICHLWVMSKLLTLNKHIEFVFIVGTALPFCGWSVQGDIEPHVEASASGLVADGNA